MLWFCDMKDVVPMRRLVAPILCFVAIFGSGTLIYAVQNPSQGDPTLPAMPAPVEMPHEPGALVVLGARMNGITGEGIKPWHLKANYTVSDAKGAVEVQGIFEEFWAAKNKARITYTVGSEAMTVYVTEQGNFRSGTLKTPNGLAFEAEREFTDPMPAIAYLERQHYEKREQKVGNTKLICIDEKAAEGFQRVGLAPIIHCFSSELPILRIELSNFGNREAVRNGIVLFQQKYVPKDVRITEQDKTEVTAHLDSLVTLPNSEEALFTPPTDAQLLPKKIKVSSGVVQGLLLKNNPPHYPENAKTLRISGTVSIQIRIGTDGSVQDPVVVSGPTQLQQAALEAVKEWVYLPCQLNGEAVEVDTMVNIAFKFGH
jgi:TonB family protein